MNATGITFGGLTSGIDTESIISRLAQLEAIPIRRLQVQQAQISQRQAIMGQLRARVSAVNTAISGLNTQSAFNSISANSSKPEVATVSAGVSGATGTYNLAVTRLATAHRITSAAQASPGSSLNLTGTVVMNGKAFQVVATDSLSTLAEKINNLNVGISANVLDGGAGQAFLSLSARDTGAAGRIQMGSLSGNVLSGLGLTNGAAPLEVRQPVTNGGISYGFSSVEVAFSEMIGATASGNFTVNGTSVSFNMATDTLETIAERINTNVSTAVATIRTVSENGKIVSKLEIAGTAAPAVFTDPNNFLQAIGFMHRPPQNQVVAAQDALYSIDGVSMTNASNTITGVIRGATITLLKGNAGTPETSTLTLTRDSDHAKAKLKAFTDAYNELVDFIRANSKFDKETFSNGPLFGDPIARQVEASLSTLLFADVPGVTTNIKNLAALGFKLADQGKLTLDDAVLDKALREQPDAVAAVFRAAGTVTNSNLTYVSSTAKTKASIGQGYDIVITQAASRAKVSGTAAQQSNSNQREILTFSGALFGSTTHRLTIPKGSSPANTVNLINNDAKLKELVSASLVGGVLTIESKKWGSAGDFSVVSDRNPGPNNTRIGPGGGIKEEGVDVQGTINGEPATGTGQFLMGNADNQMTSGLQIQYTGTAIGFVGRISVSRGLGVMMSDLLNTYTDTVSGFFSANDKSLTTQYEDFQKRIDLLNERVGRRQEDLRKRFAAMELAIMRSQSQSARLQAMLRPPGQPQ
jgi:flagellar hook-associated protein 2